MMAFFSGVVVVLEVAVFDVLDGCVSRTLINLSDDNCSPSWKIHTVVNLWIYCTAQNFDGGNIDEFDKFTAIRLYFPYQNCPFS